MGVEQREAFAAEKLIRHFLDVNLETDSEEPLSDVFGPITRMASGICRHLRSTYRPPYLHSAYIVLVMLPYGVRTYHIGVDRCFTRFITLIVL